MNNSSATGTSRSGRSPCAAAFDTPGTDRELREIEARAAAAGFWSDPDGAQDVLRRRRRLQDDRDLAESLRRKAEDLNVLVEWIRQGEPVQDDLAAALDALEAEVEAGEVKKTLGGEHDDRNAIVTIHPGTGGTEAQDWAEMLARAYLRWAGRRDFKVDVIEWQPGDEAGIKAGTLTIAGDYAYGLMLAEAGVHRLVRVSPFDRRRAGTRRSPRCSCGPNCPETSRSRSTTGTYASTGTGRAGRAGSTST